ncbi:MAG: suppressor of fused domain protein [Saprospiraceae bacterium]
MQAKLDPIEIIDAHLDQFFEEDEVIVFHEINTPEDENHIDIYWIRASKDVMDFAILLTVGMSRVEQNLEGDYDAPNFMEVMMLVPWDWNFSDYHWTDDEYWPIHHLKTIAKIPSDQNTWYGYGHTISWKSDSSLISGTGFNGSILLNTRILPDEFINIKVNDQKTIHIFSAIPVYPEELDFKIKYSADELIDKFNRYQIDEVVDINRKNTCKKRWWQWR